MYKVIKKYESLKLSAYKCPAGHWTIGYGNRYHLDGSKVAGGDAITLSTAELMLEEAIKEIESILPVKLMKMLTNNQREAVISLVFNIGTGAFLRSNLYKAILDEDYKMICKNWDWYSAGGKVLKGLIKRRTEELALFCQDI